MAVSPLVVFTIKGKLAEVLGVFVPFCTCSVMPLVEGIVTVVVQVTVPVQVSRTVSPLAAEEIAELTAEAEQSAGPTLIVAP